MNLMEKTDAAESYFNHTLNDQKYYFAGYLNLAQNNIKTLEKAYGEYFLSSGNNPVINDLTNTTSLIDWDFKMKFLSQYLPVVSYLNLDTDLNATFDKKKKEFTKNLASLFKAIESLRNFYSHYYHHPLTEELNNELLSNLDKIFVAVCINVKKKRMKDDKTKQLLKATLNDELDLLLKAKKEELLKKKKEGKKVSTDAISMKNSVLNDAFNHLIQLEKNSKKEIPGRYYTSVLSDNNKYTENGINISMSGLLFLLSMFLTKKQNEDVRSLIFGFKGTIEPDKDISKSNNSFRNMATNWVFSYLSFKGMKKQLGNTFKKESLLVQIVDELSKVPHEVYQTLSPSRQEMFLEDMNEYLKEGNKKHCLEESFVVHPIIRKRYEDKFNYFAIRYLDEFVEFPSLRFQVNVGNYVHDRRKKTIDGTNAETDRMVKEEIRAFGKLSVISKLKADYFAKDLSSEVSWEMYPNPSYNFSANNIPVYIDLIKSSVAGAVDVGKNHMSYQAKLDLDEKGKKRNRTEGKKDKKGIAEILLGKKNKQIIFEKPTVLLSLNELPAMLYEVLKEGGDKQDIGKRIEDKIVEKIVAHYNLLDQYDGTTELSGSVIPRKLKKNRSEESLNMDKLLRAVKRELEITQEKLDLIKTNQKKFNSKEKDEKGKSRQYVFYTNELGQEATWIANDIKRFMPKEVKEKWRGYHHSNLQKLIALYDQTRNEAVKCITCFWNFDQQTSWGKGIKEAFYKSTFEEFYKAYLEHRMDVYKTLENNLIAGKGYSKLFNKEKKKAFILFDEHLYTIPDINTQKERLKSTLFILPRGIFDSKPTFIKGIKYEEDPSCFADWYQFANATGNQYQRFYDLPRSYTSLFEETKKNNEGLIENKKGLSAKEQLDFFKMRQDLKIKKIKAQDLFLFLIVKDLYKKVFNHALPAEIGLNDMYQTLAERQANYDLAVKQSQRTEGDNSDNLYNYNFLWNLTIPFEYDKIKEPQVKLKDIGKFYKFAADKKVQTILSYSDREWSKLDLEKELELMPTSYEVIRREQLLRDIQQFEKRILENYPSDGNVHPADLEKEDKDKKRFPNFNLYLLKGVIIKNNLASEEERQWFEQVHLDKTSFYPEVTTKSKIIQSAYLLLLIRNKMLHNQLPSKQNFEFMTTLYPFQGYESYSTYLLSVTKQTIECLSSAM